MSTEADPDLSAIDAGLGQLPQWQPPADFAVRLAAAAARQSQQPVAVALSTRRWLWASVVRRAPLALGSGLLALALAVPPWGSLAGSAQFVWWVAGGAAVAGVALTVRVIRAP